MLRNDDRTRLRDYISQRQIVRRRFARLAIVNRERADRGLFVRLDRERPATAVAELVSDVGPRLAAWLGMHIRRDDRFAGRRGQSAGERIRTDGEAVDLLQVFIRHGPGAPDRMERGAVRVGGVKGGADIAIA